MSPDDMRWLRDIEKTDLMVLPNGDSCPCPHCKSTRKLAAAVRLAEKSVDRTLAHVDSPRDAAEELGDLLARLRSGEVEEERT